MGCVSSNLLSHEDEFTQLGSSALSHHIVSLTSSTYGLLSLDPPRSTPTQTTPPIPHQRFGAATPEKTPLPQAVSKPLWSETRPIRPGPEVINSWELMAGLDAESFRFFSASAEKENSNPNRVSKPPTKRAPSKRFETGLGAGETVVLYVTSLRGVRKTFEDCAAVRAAIEGFGVSICERDVSMDRGFREELRGLTRGKEGNPLPPQVVVRGKHVGGAEEVLRLAEDGLLGGILHGLPKRKAGSACEGCGGVRFLPCFECSGSCKVVLSKTEVARCSECNENGLVLCPICT